MISVKTMPTFPEGVLAASILGHWPPEPSKVWEQTGQMGLLGNCVAARGHGLGSQGQNQVRGFCDSKGWFKNSLSGGECLRPVNPMPVWETESRNDICPWCADSSQSRWRTVGTAF